MKFGVVCLFFKSKTCYFLFCVHRNSAIELCPSEPIIICLIWHCFTIYFNMLYMISYSLSYKLDAANVLVIGTENSMKEYDPGMIFFFR